MAIVTGAGQGIGFACARRFVEAGMRVVITDIDGDLVARSSRSLEKRGATVLGCPADVTDEAACIGVATQALAAWGRIDAFVGNAGVQLQGSLTEAAPADWRAMLDVNVQGVAYGCKSVLPCMVEQRAGAIVLISSVSALAGTMNMPLYCASKAALIGLMRSLAVEYGGRGVRVNAVCPGATVTEFHERRAAARGMSPDALRAAMKGYGALGRAAEPREIANAVHFLCSAEASFITGQVLAVDGGFTLHPGNS